MLDAFVRRHDRGLLARAYDELTEAGHDPTTPGSPWPALAAAPTYQHKQRIVDDLGPQLRTHDGEAVRDPHADLAEAMNHLRAAIPDSYQRRTRDTTQGHHSAYPDDDRGQRARRDQQLGQNERASGYDTGY